MIELPNSTIVNRFLPKEKFYSKTKMSTKLRKQFTDEIEKITWANKISPDTLNVSADENDELQVFEILLKCEEISLSVLRQIDLSIPYPILFILKKLDLRKAAISFKENSKPECYFDTPWQKDLNLELKGRSVSEIYNNYLYQIEPILKNEKYNNIKSAVEAFVAKNLLQSKIDSLHKQLRNELSIAKKQDLAIKRFELEQQKNEL